MATSALSVSNVKQRLALVMFEGANNNQALQDAGWMDTFDWRYDQDRKQIDAAAMTGIPSFSNWNEVADVTPSGITSLDQKNFTYVALAASVTFGPLTPSEIPNYRQLVLRKLGFSTISTIYETAASAKADAFTETTGNHAVHGTKSLFATDHEMVGGTRSNKIVSATFDRAAYLAGRNGMRTHNNYQGQVFDLTAAGISVEYHTNNDEAVKQAILSKVTSDQQQINIAANDKVRFIANPYFEDEDDVILGTEIEGEKAFLGWERLPPTMFVGRDSKNVNEQVTIVMAYGFGSKGVPDGAFGITAD